MGKYDDITPDRLRSELLRFARLIQRMEGEGILLRSSPSLLAMLGELRQMLFAYEIRGTKNLKAAQPQEEDEPAGGAPASEGDPVVAESLRIVREAARRERELLDELEHRFLKREGEDES